MMDTPLDFFWCECCHHLLWDPVSLPCGYSLCRPCFLTQPFQKHEHPGRAISNLDSEPIPFRISPIFCDAPASAPSFSSPNSSSQSNNNSNTASPPTAFIQESNPYSTTYTCPVQSCQKVHVFRNEKPNIVLTKIIENLFPSESLSYHHLRKALHKLESLSRDLGIQVDWIHSFDTVISIFGLPSDTVMIDDKRMVLELIDSAIEKSAHLLKPRQYRAALLWSLGQFDDAIKEARLLQSLDAKDETFSKMKAFPSAQLLSGNEFTDEGLEKLEPLTWDDSKMRSISASDLDCQVCLTTLHEPITTPCGHTWCKSCLLTSIDHSHHCPLCRTLLPDYGYFSQRPVNRALAAFLMKTYTLYYLNKSLQQPLLSRCKDQYHRKVIERIPIFVCSLAFPGSMYGFHLFEPRYRVLIKRCMDTQRRFGICLPTRLRADPSSGVEFINSYADFGTMVHIRHCEPVANGDLAETVEGALPRFVIDTVGVHRFKVLNRYNDPAGYHLADVERFDDIEPDDLISEDSTRMSWNPNKIARLHRKLVEFCTSFNQSLHPAARCALEREFGPPPQCVSLLTYWLTQFFPIGVEEKFEMLKLDRIELRLEKLFSWIDQESLMKGDGSCPTTA